MGWTVIHVYGKLSMREKIEECLDTNAYRVLEHSCKNFKDVMVAIEDKKTGEIEVFELIIENREDGIGVKEFGCGDLYGVCPKKMLPYLKQCKSSGAKKLLERTLKKQKEKKGLSLKSGEYYVLKRGQALTVGSKAYLFQYKNRCLHTSGMKVTGGLRVRKELVSINSIKRLNELPQWLTVNRVGRTDDGRNLVLLDSDVTNRITELQHKEELAAIHNDYVKSLGDTIFIINDDAVCTNLSISNEVLTEKLMEQRQKIIERKKLKGDVFDVFDNSDDFRDDHQERNEINEPHEQFKAGGSIEKKGVHEFQMTLF